MLISITAFVRPLNVVLVHAQGLVVNIGFLLNMNMLKRKDRPFSHTQVDILSDANQRGV